MQQWEVWSNDRRHCGSTITVSCAGLFNTSASLVKQRKLKYSPLCQRPKTNLREHRAAQGESTAAIIAADFYISFKTFDVTGIEKGFMKRQSEVLEEQTLNGSSLLLLLLLLLINTNDRKTSHQLSAVQGS